MEAIIDNCGQPTEALIHDIIATDDDDDEDRLRCAVALLHAHLSCGVDCGWQQQPHIIGRPVERDIIQESRASTSPAEARRIADSFIRLPDQMFFDLFRMPKATFFDLVQWLRDHTLAQGSRYTTLEQRVLVFLWLMAFNETHRNAARAFHLNRGTISRIFHCIKGPMRRLHETFVRPLPSGYVSTAVELDEDLHEFNGAVGCLDGTHVPAHIRRDMQQRFWDRNGNVTQNVLVAVTFDGIFTYVMAGAEGSMNDRRLLTEALQRRFEVPEHRYYLGDSGFGMRKICMVPYNGLYHLQEFAISDRPPEDEKELFNLRHSQLRTMVEQAIGKCKRKWKIIRTSAAEYDFPDQIAIIYACTGLSNFIALSGRSYEEVWQEEVDALMDSERSRLDKAARNANVLLAAAASGTDLRRKISQWMWEQYNI